MRYKDLIIPLALALLTTWGFNQFFFNKNSQAPTNQPQPGQSFTAPTWEEISKPLHKSISFSPESAAAPAVTITPLETEYGTLTFSTNLGALDRIDFKRQVSGKDIILTPLYQCPENPRYGFVVALDDQTPRFYTLESVTKDEKQTHITYKADGALATITKEFIVDHAVPRIDLQLTIEPRRSDVAIQPRLFMPAPYMPDADAQAAVSGIVYTDRQKLQKLKIGSIENQFWFSPTLFGAESRYFVGALVADTNSFTRRAYYTGTTASTLDVLMEGEFVREKKSWNLSFYYGPKDAHTMNQVDPRLEVTLDYGWFSSLVKIFLSILKFLYNYVRNYGWAIILLTLLIQLLLLPITFRSKKSLDKQKEFQRKMQYVEQKYKANPEQLARERLELAKKYGSSNLLLAGSQIIQIPILVALNRLLANSIELYQAPFAGWITDLSARDPYYILPILAGVGLLVQSSADTDIRRNISMLLFAAVVIAFTATFSAGLALYFAASTWFKIMQLYGQKALKV